MILGGILGESYHFRNNRIGRPAFGGASLCGPCGEGHHDQGIAQVEVRQGNGVREQRRIETKVIGAFMNFRYSGVGVNSFLRPARRRFFSAEFMKNSIKFDKFTMFFGK